MSVHLPNLKYIYTNTIPEDVLVPYCSTTFFNGNRDIAEIIYDCYEGLSICYLTENMLNNVQTEQTKKFILRIFKNFSVFIPDVQIDDFRNPLQLRKLIFYSKKNNWNEFKSYCASPSQWGRLSMEVVNNLMLIQCNRTYPINQADPITQEQIHPNDCFTSERGECFSLTSLIEFHNTRPYRGSIGEQNNSKFIINPLSNKPFSVKETLEIIRWSIRLNKPLTELHQEHMSPLALQHEPADYQFDISLNKFNINERERLENPRTQSSRQLEAATMQAWRML